MQTFDSRDALTEAATDTIAAWLREGIAARGRASLMASGGSTPGPVYEALSARELDWSHVVVGLADERWVPETDAGSNAALVRRTLLQGKAASATFIPMFSPSHAFGPDAASDCAGRYAEATKATDALVLGMGPDGHTLSWFAGADGIGAAMDPSSKACVSAVHAKESAVTGRYLDRMTLTAAAVAASRNAILLITGDEKRAVFEAEDVQHPVHALKDLLGTRLCVYWAP